VSVCTVLHVEMGDKLSKTTGAQKATVGLLVPDHEMPYCTRGGVVADLVVNPHAIPSRMTVGYIVEALLSKVAAVTAQRRVVVPFEADDILSAADDDGDGDVVSRAMDELAARGFERHGLEAMVDARTGHTLETQIFVCPLHVQRLRHLVRDKVQVRGLRAALAARAVDPQTRQPVRGRARGAAIRVGEMEHWALLAHGASRLLRDLFSVDASRMHVDLATGLPAARGDAADQEGAIACVGVPHAFKLLVQHLAAMGVSVKLDVSVP
jgi:DNA-directed RNA polymerase II subunit RPB2